MFSIEGNDSILFWNSSVILLFVKFLFYLLKKKKKKKCFQINIKNFIKKNFFFNQQLIKFF